jgi:hypothetical protein
MKHEDTLNLQLAFLVNTALIVGFLVAILLGDVAYRFQGSMLGNTPTSLNSSPALSQNH